MFNKLIKFLSLLALVAMLSSCASIISDNTYSVAFSSTPNGASFVVKNEDGEIVHQGTTPQSVSLSSDAGFLDGETYTVEYTKDGVTKTAILETELSGWYFGNLLFGGVIGMLIVDPATGSMFNLPEKFEVDLGMSESSVSMKNKRTLKVLSLNDVPSSLRKDLVKIN